MKTPWLYGGDGLHRPRWRTAGRGPGRRSGRRRLWSLGFQRLEPRQVLAAAPVLDPAAAPTLTMILEDAGVPVGRVGTLVSAVVDAGGPLANFSDADGDLPGIAITGTNPQGGTLWYSTDDGTTWRTVGVVSAQSPRLLAADATTRIAFQPAANYSGSITDVFSFKAWDRTALPWVQVGGDIDGETVEDFSGYPVSLSADGSTVAIGAYLNDGNGVDSGHTRIYRWTGTAWQQLGGDIDGEAALDQSGSSVSLSADGSTVAIGAVRNGGNGINSGHTRIYRWTGTVWAQVGGDIDGEVAGDESGSSVSLSTDGSTVAIGAVRNGGNGPFSGHTRIYRWTGTAWQQLGGDVDGEAAEDWSGASVSLSADGSTVAIGAPYNGGNGTFSGHTRIYRWTGTAWQQLGGDIDGEGAFDQSGYSVSLSADGSTVAIATPFNGGNGLHSGHTRIYRWTGTAWQQLGGDVDGEAAGDWSGVSVSLSADGSTVAIGAARNGGNGIESGHTRIYRWTGTAWQKLAADIDGEATGDYSGLSVSLSADGSTVAIGALYNGGNGTNSGHTRIYRLSPSVSTVTDTVSIAVAATPDLPVLNPAAAPALAGILEDAGVPVGRVGTLVSAVVDAGGPLANFSDTDGDLPGIAITGTNLQGGTLWYSTDDGTTWLDVGSVSAQLPRLLAADATTRITFQPAANYSGSITDVFSFKAWDRTALPWVQVGGDIDGEAEQDYSGYRVSLSADGSTVAIGAPGNDVNGTASGHTRIYRWTGTVWAQVGGDIDGEAAGDESGSSVSLSTDGSTVAIGAVRNDGNGIESGHTRIYRWTGTAWQQLGGDIDGEAAYDWLGYSVSLSADGSTVAIGTPFNGGNGTNSGHTRIYRWNGTAWQQLGGDIDGETVEDFSGYPVSLSADGSTVAIGAAGNDGNGTNSGHTRIYRWTGTAWQQLGDDIDGEAAFDQSGSSVSLSADGSTVAIGAIRNDGNGTNSGHTRIYRWTGTAWQQLGGDIDGEAAFDQSGSSVSLSADGSTVAIGAILNDGNGTNSGYTRIYRWTGTAWQKLAANIDGEATGDYSGLSVSLSADGSTVAIGAPYNGGNGTNSGHTRIYRLSPSVSTVTDTVSIAVAATPDLPVLNPAAAPALAGILEDAGVPVGRVGTLVSAVVDAGGPLANFSDTDGDLPGIAITGTNLQGGTLWYSTDDGTTWRTVGVVSAQSPRLLAADATTRIAFQPAANYSGSITDVFSFKAWDRTALPWVQVGGDIDGEAEQDYSGYRVSLSADGSTVAIGTPFNGGNGYFSGHTRIYRWTGTAWQQLGGDIDGEAAGNESGSSVSLSTDGSTVAIGAVRNGGNGTDSGHTRIYRWTGTAWQQLGGDVDGEAAWDQSGYSVSLSADGSTVAIGAIRNDGNGTNSGHTRIYRWTGTAWAQMGGDIDGEAAWDQSGYSVSLSADGSTVAIGALANDGNGNGSGHTRIYRWTGTAWQQVGGDIDGEAAGDESGSSVSLSADGSTVAIGAIRNDGNGTNSGHTRIYRWNGTAWPQMGGDIDGEAAGDQSGISVSLSADGSTVAIGTPFIGGNGVDSGYTRIYLWTGTAWQKLAADIDGEAAGDYSGLSVSLSADGSTVAIGAPYNGGNGTNSGHTRIYRLSPSVSTVTDTVSIAVAAVNDAPTNILLSGTSIPENAGVNVVLGVFSATDPDVGDTFTYALVPGVGDTGNGAFSIGPDNGLRTATSFNFERQASYAIRVRATDATGAFVERAFTITVGDVNEAPVIDHIIAPPNGSYRAGQPLLFTAVLTQPVTQVGSGVMDIGLVVGRAAQKATLVGGLGTNRLTFRYLPTARMNDADGVTLAGSMRLPRGAFLQDAQGRRLSTVVPAAVTAGVLVDTTAPVIRSIARPAGGTYRPGQELLFTAVLSERVTVMGTPAIAFTLGSARRLASYISGSGTSTLTFRYVVQPGDLAPRGIRITPQLVMSGAAITDTAGNAVVPSFKAPSGSSIILAPALGPSMTARQAAFAGMA